VIESPPTILHFVTQWMWLSGSFVHGPLAASQHRTIVVSRMPVINEHVYPPPPGLIDLGDPDVAEGVDTAALVADRLGGVRPDLVHVHHGYNLCDAAAVAARFRVPLAASFWGYDVTALPLVDPSRIVPHLHVPQGVIVPSRFLARTVRSLGVDSARIRIIPGSVDERFYVPTALPEAMRVAFVGRFVEKKGVDVLLDAWVDVRRSVTDAELTLLGFGEVVPDSDPTLGIRVVAPDPVDPREQVRDVIEWCRVYVSPSKTASDGDSESQHIGNLEAHAAGRAVVTTEHAAIPEFVEHGVNGLVVGENDSGALADALIELLRDWEQCRRLADEARRTAERFRVGTIAATRDALHTELIGR
jgi:colanic acid/amylovoran biosynthesis glycosyltransferase